ncbi:hypothetical protein DMH01_22935 [Amycolatopsis sp. WAC 04182]|uniref:hypothetical protein n=1 Tax=Amycolatopsis sp. WAC 04182 TaxID=2203198 RepID=UPI000F7A2531|nr:hypothetical protein [Amycolatopsis sp. WAC 04182]RSN58865.1 hypothetical protein DMH01_22935 [Amycolatopsis sp. WAC 04182]
MSVYELKRGIEQSRQALMEDSEAAFRHIETKWDQATDLFNRATDGYLHLLDADLVVAGFIEVPVWLLDIQMKRSFMSAAMMTMHNKL